MKPEGRSQTLLSITRSKAKMYEYDVPKEHHITIPTDPAKLFNLAIGLLGDLAAQTNTKALQDEDSVEIASGVHFAAHFFDAYLQSRLGEDLDSYLTILGSAAYYLCDLPGSSRVLAGQLKENRPDLQCLGLEVLLLWLLQWKPLPFTRGKDQANQESIDVVSRSLLEFYDGSGSIDQVFENAQRLRRTAYDIGTARQLLFADTICAILRKRWKNSSRYCLPIYSSLPTEQWAEVLNKPSFMRELWPAQKLLGARGVYKGRSAVIQMPTSAGKTRATELVIRSAFLAGRTSLAVIVAPFRALCHEIRNSFSAAFHGEMVNVDELSDVFATDFSIQELLGQKQVLVVTPEKLVYVLRHNPELAEHIGLLIFDEGHQFDSGTRGITYELLLASLKAMVPKSIQTLLISAVIRNAESIGTWLNDGDFELIAGTNLMPTYRTIGFTSWKDRLGRIEFIDPEKPDHVQFFVPRVIEQQELSLRNKERKKRQFPTKDDGQTIALYLGLKLVHNGSVAVFCARKTSAEALCDKVVEAYERGLKLQPPVESANPAENERLIFLYVRNLGSDSTATTCARLGIFAHHANVPHGIRLAVEYAMKKRLARFVICTSTLAQGVNLPIRYLIVTSIYQGREPMSVRDFSNLIGRAGRADEHTEGSILFADPEIYDLGGSRWSRTENLLHPENSEPCTSSLSSILEPLHSDNRYSSIVGIEPIDIVMGYVNDTLTELTDDVLQKHGEHGYTKDGIEVQIAWKVSIMSAIENYLMSFEDKSKPNLTDQDVVQLAMGTFAFFLSDTDQKNTIVQIFRLLADNIQHRVTDATRRRVYGRTLYGVVQAESIERWVVQHIEDLTACDDNDELLIALWPLLTANISNGAFRRCNPLATLRDATLKWIQGEPFNDIHSSMLKANACMIAGKQKRNLKLESVVDIFENGVSYDGGLVIAAAVEIMGLLQPGDNEKLTIQLLALQKRLKYGLPTLNSITVYELGFADRAVAIDLSSLLEGTHSDKQSVFNAMSGRENEIRDVLDKYPSYFSERFNALIGQKRRRGH